jgi:hypothetical protein
MWMDIYTCSPTMHSFYRLITLFVLHDLGQSCTNLCKFSIHPTENRNQKNYIYIRNGNTIFGVLLQNDMHTVCMNKATDMKYCVIKCTDTKPSE